jgi:apolipoprotein N-acyltransferase
MAGPFGRSVAYGWLPWLWLVAGSLFTLFSSGRWLFPLAAWLAPVFMLRFVRSQIPVVGLLAGGVVTVAAYVVAWRGMVPVEGSLYFVITGSIGVVYWLPYVADRFVWPRIAGFAATLVFPLAFVSIELISLLANPYFTWGSLAYSQYGFLPLKQLASLTGLPGIVFVVTWFGAVANWAWERDFSWKQTWRGVATYASIVAAVLIYGGARLAWDNLPTETVRVVGLAMSDEMADKWIDGYVNPERIDAHSQSILDDYIVRTRQAVAADVQIVSWDEGAIMVSPSKEDDAIQQGQRLAQERQIYLLMPLLVVAPDEESPAVNKVVLIDPRGEIAFEYVKTAAVPGDDQMRGEKPLAATTTAMGKIAAAICFDMDDPRVIRTAGRARVGLLLVPSDDWPAIDPLHSWMASFRAIENGFSMVRPTREAVSEACDSRGRVLASTSAATPDHLMIANVPVKSAWTLYPFVGNLFAWLGLAGFALAVVVAAVRSR